MIKTSILFEDNDILIVHKPQGIATQSSRVGQADVVSELKNHLAGKQKGKPYLGVVHRLDQPVEGLLVFAKNKEAAAKLTKQLAGGGLHKQYYAVICGKPSQREGKLVDYLYKDENNKAQIVTEGDTRYGEGKKAVLRYHILPQKPCISSDTVISTDFLLVDICIETGRFHQIRAQMAHAGMPLLGDAKYGNEVARELSEGLGIRSTALCAYWIRLLHPATEKMLEFKVSPQGKAFSFFEI